MASAFDNHKTGIYGLMNHALKHNTFKCSTKCILQQHRAFEEDYFNIFPPKPDEEVLADIKSQVASLQEIMDLYHYKCDFTMNDDGSVTFWLTQNCEPSTHINLIQIRCDLALFWILQAVAFHVDVIAEQLRSEYVMHEDKMALEVRRDDFILGCSMVLV